MHKDLFLFGFVKGERGEGMKFLHLQVQRQRSSSVTLLIYTIHIKIDLSFTEIQNCIPYIGDSIFFLKILMIFAINL